VHRELISFMTVLHGNGAGQDNRVFPVRKEGCQRLTIANRKVAFEHALLTQAQLYSPSLTAVQLRVLCVVAQVGSPVWIGSLWQAGCQPPRQATRTVPARSPDFGRTSDAKDGDARMGKQQAAGDRNARMLWLNQLYDDLVRNRSRATAHFARHAAGCKKINRGFHENVMTKTTYAVGRVVGRFGY
jgi:hypothetical protein